MAYLLPCFLYLLEETLCGKNIYSIIIEVVTPVWLNAGNRKSWGSQFPWDKLGLLDQIKETERCEMSLKPHGWLSDCELESLFRLPWPYVITDLKPESHSRCLQGQVMISSSKKIPLKTVTVQITCQVESNPTELYSRIIF